MMQLHLFKVTHKKVEAELIRLDMKLQKILYINVDLIYKPRKMMCNLFLKTRGRNMALSERGS